MTLGKVLEEVDGILASNRDFNPFSKKVDTSKQTIKPFELNKYFILNDYIINDKKDNEIEILLHYKHRNTEEIIEVKWDKELNYAILAQLKGFKRYSDKEEERGVEKLMADNILPHTNNDDVEYEFELVGGKHGVK
jgi:hypothetical protein